MNTKACPLCLGVTPRVPLSASPHAVNVPPYVQCQRCGLVFHDIWPIPRPAPGPLSQETYTRYTNWKLPTNRERLRWLTDHAPVPRGRAVDIGTKDGSTVKVLSDMGWQAVGYDPDDRFHPYARERHGVELRSEWFTAEAVGRGTLDLVTAYHVLEHVPEPQPWLSEIREALRPGGYLHIELPNLCHIQARQINPGHVVLYTPNTLRQTLERAGFRVLVTTEYAPGGNRTYDQLSVVAQRDRPKAVQFSVSEIDRPVQRYLQHPTLEFPPSPVLPIRIYRGVKRRIRVAFRRARYHGLF